jgi:cleavage stimulation factor subunit 3
MAADAELAFLQAQQDEYDPSAGYTMTDAPTGQEEYDPAATYSPRSDQSASMQPESAANSPPAAAETEGENGLKPQPTQTSTDASAAPSKRPRTVGGFVDESEEEEEEPAAQPSEASAALLKASGATESPQRSFTNTPSNTFPNPPVQLHSAQSEGLIPAPVAVNEPALSIASLPNGSTPVPDATKPDAPDVMTISTRPSAAPVTPASTSASLPKARLPQDRVGILEDLIAEDPRGAIESWLSLIEEHRRRHKHEEARATFERFLKIFPSSVSKTDYVSCDLTNMPRARHGSTTSRLRPSLTSCPGLSTFSAAPFLRPNMSAPTPPTSTSSGVAST